MSIFRFEYELFVVPPPHDEFDRLLILPRICASQAVAVVTNWNVQFWCGCRQPERGALRPGLCGVQLGWCNNWWLLQQFVSFHLPNRLSVLVVRDCEYDLQGL